MLDFSYIFGNKIICFSQCKHTIPAVCMTRVGAGLNLLILTSGQKKLFTVDLVPAIQVKVAKDFDGLKLRQVTVYKVCKC